MKPADDPQDPELGALQATYENNPAHGHDLLGFAALFLVAGLIVLVLAFRQDLLRDQLTLIAGGLLGLAVGVKLLADFRGRLNASATLYEGGLVVTGRNKQRVVIRWDDVTEVYERVIRGGSQMKHAEGWVYTVYHRGGRPVKLDNAIVRTRELGTAVQAAVHERMWPQALARYQAGETVRFGRQVGIGRQGLVLGPRTLPWERVAELRYSREGSLQVVLKERRRVWKTVPQAFIANYTTLQALVRQIDELKPSPTPPARQPAPARRSTFPAGSIGDVSVRINYDVRDLFMEGYTMQDIQGILDGCYTLEEMRQRKPGRGGRRRR